MRTPLLTSRRSLRTAIPTAAAFAILSPLMISCSSQTSAGPPATLRLDYVHTGAATEESFTVDGLVREGEWPGPLNKTIDTIEFGKYFFEVRSTGGRLLYSRGFASIFGEWELTAEAKQKSASFHESLRFPCPEGPVRVVLKKRDEQMKWREVWTTEVDPAAATPWQPPQEVHLWPVIENGAPADKADLLLLGDGYTASEMDNWHADARRLAETLFAVSPFKERRADFNVWALDVPAAESGIAQPSDGIERESPVRATYDALGSERYILTFDNKRLRDVAAAAPYEFVEIVTNSRKYGGGGIYNLFATVAAGNAFTDYIFVHEFGHHFAGLADEYYTSDVAYESTTERAEPWEPNVTADPRKPKWQDLLTPRLPLPTPWPKQQYEAYQQEYQSVRRKLREAKAPEEKMEELFRAERARSTALLADGVRSGIVGAFEGAMYESQGYYRPQIDCIMFSRNEVGFCQVCQRAISRMIDLYTARGD